MSAVLGGRLGLEVHGPEREPDLGVDILWVNAGGARLEFLQPVDSDSEAGRLAKAHGRFVHVALTVDSLERAVERLSAAGIGLMVAPRAGAHGSRVAFIDPVATGGALVELVEHR